MSPVEVALVAHAKTCSFCEYDGRTEGVHGIVTRCAVGDRLRERVERDRPFGEPSTVDAAWGARLSRPVVEIGTRPGDGWRDPEALAKLPSDAARKAALQVADALDAFHAVEPGPCAWCGRPRTEHAWPPAGFRGSAPTTGLCPGTTSSFYTPSRS